jgi:hypothetical protein
MNKHRFWIREAKKKKKKKNGNWYELAKLAQIGPNSK